MSQLMHIVALGPRITISCFGHIAAPGARPVVLADGVRAQVALVALAAGERRTSWVD
jgi:hypothetical protein